MEAILPWIIGVLLGWFIIKKLLPVKGVQNITVQETQKRLKEKNVQWIDVRTPGEYRANHKKPFKNVPLSDLAKRSGELDRNQEIVLICQSGMRSMNAAKVLKKQGFDKITNVKGGMSAWG
ncbi:rhodanese-like domain-containing protein [Halobacillus litoralis]|uniref:Rhodanese-like domain-containing protein n=1 Tax=Halobacillus litoralis TaxID=45668 RepID=A0A845DYG8_9BACI|nr:rhodanese-like domain-containing protein [Halobacillus litoralis]MYL48070.1 rhodanese-like domain-containing protein [Halobacillus litoralis]